MSTSSIWSSESGGEKRKCIDEAIGILISMNQLDDEVNSNGLIDRIPKNVTTMHQVTLLFEDYDESKPQAAETSNVIANIFNFISAMAGNRVKTGATGDLKGVYGRAEYFNDTYDNFPRKSDEINKFLQYIPNMYKSTWPPLFQQYVAEMWAEEPSRDWIKRHSSIPNGEPSVLKKYFFGYRVCSATHPPRTTKPKIRILGIVVREGCAALHYSVHFFLRIFSFAQRS